MKKQYIAPECITVNHATQQMLAVSLKYDGVKHDQTADSDRMDDLDLDWDD